jgi:multiple sugar transport system permease protein
MKLSKVFSKPSFQGYAFVLPAFFVLFALTGYPVIYNMILSLFKTGYGEQTFVGLNNYLKAFTSIGFAEVVKNTLIWTVVNMGIMMILGMSAALAINRNVRGKTTFQAILLIPWVIPFVVSGIMWAFLFHPRWGAINDILLRLKLVSEPLLILGQPQTALFGVMLAYIWKVYPFVTVLILAGLKAIPEVLYDAASIDGADGFKSFRYVTLPALRTILSTIILVVGIWTFNTFDLIYVMTGGGPIYASETVAMRIYKFAFSDFRFGLSAATSLIASALLIIASFFYLRGEERV